MKVLVCGGHLTPALAVINNLPKNTEVLYAGRKYSMEADRAVSLEYQIIHKRKITFAHLETGRLQRKLSSQTISSLVKFPKGFLQAWQIINKFSPDVIVGFGSYVSLPLGFAGWLQHVPLVLHEQTLGAGLTNRLLTPLATAVGISWGSSKQFFDPQKTTLTGNPSVEAYFKVEKVKKNPSELPTLVIVGGSQGSHFINSLISCSLDLLLKKFNITHQTGDAQKFDDYEHLCKIQKTLPVELKNRYNLVKFLDPDDIANIFSGADIVVTRGGINTILGLLILGKPALVIPLLTSSQQEQRKNAQLFKQAGLGETAYQERLTSETFINLLTTMMHNINAYGVSETFKNNLGVHKNASEKLIKLITYATSSRKKQKT